MMIHAYNELYLYDAQLLLANSFDYAINDCELSPNYFTNLFINSNISKQIENGNPSIISGKSGVEITQDILSNINPLTIFPEQNFSTNRSEAYWAGWALAYYQWKTRKTFKNIFQKISLDEILSMYKLFHEMDLSNFVEEMDKRYNSINLETKLKLLRQSIGLSQSELSKLSGVSLRAIQLYEQKVNDIDKAQTHTLYKLSKVLGCNIEDLLENPETFK